MSEIEYFSTFTNEPPIAPYTFVDANGIEQDGFYVDEDGIITEEEEEKYYSSPKPAARPIVHEVAKVVTPKTNYGAWMYALKFREAYMADAYYCPANKKTVGFGHNLSARHPEHIEVTARRFMADGVMTYDEATQLLILDCEQTMDIIRREFPHLSTDQVRAVTSLAMNCGLYKIMYVKGDKAKGYTNFWQKLKAKQVPNFNPYCIYKDRNGKWVKSTNLIRARRFEQALFQGDHTEVAKMGEFFRKKLVERDILPAKKRGMYVPQVAEARLRERS